MGWGLWGEKNNSGTNSGTTEMLGHGRAGGVGGGGGGVEVVVVVLVVVVVVVVRSRYQ